MSDFDSGNSVNCVLLDVNLYETKREKLLVPCSLFPVKWKFLSFRCGKYSPKAYIFYLLS